MAEEYNESIIIRQDGGKVEEPSFSDDQCDAEFEFKGTIKLVQINKSVQNATHNKHDYVFKIIEIEKIEGIVE